MKSFKYTKNPFAYLAIVLLSMNSHSGFSQFAPSLVNFDAYQDLVSEVKEHRKTHLLNAEEFVATSKNEKVIILDTRSDSMYMAAHVKGAIHLNFSDFTQENLAKVIPSPDYKILIYCNNNFESKPLALNVSSLDLSPYFVTKQAFPPKFDVKKITKPKSKSKAKTKSKSGPSAIKDVIQENVPVDVKPITLALNIPTYINLYGYGYRNIYELSELVNTNSGKIEFEGTAVSIQLKK
ncbi:MAG: rhodanese-like domain-containing protein [Bacteroidia bacterium]|nr:rhodanese-like domain-containing protein [Bacteroidia bacterium]